MILQAAAWGATAGKFGWMIMTQTGPEPKGFRLRVLSRRSHAADPWSCGGSGGRPGDLVWTQSGAGESAAESKNGFGASGGLVLRQLPLAFPWLLSSLVATAVLATEMTVVDLYGFRTVADEFYCFTAEPSLFSIHDLRLAALDHGNLMTWLLVERRKFVVSRSESDVIRDDVIGIIRMKPGQAFSGHRRSWRF